MTAGSKGVLGAVSCVALALACSPAFGGSLFGSNIRWEHKYKEYPPRQERPKEISSRHEAYLNGYKKSGVMLIEEASKDAVKDAAAARGAHLVFMVFHEKYFDKLERTVESQREVGIPGYKRWEITYGTRATYTKAHFVEMYAPGPDYLEGFNRFCDRIETSTTDGTISSRLDCGDMNLMKRYIALGVDVSQSGILGDLAANAAQLCDSARYAKGREATWLKQRMDANLEMIVYAIQHGAKSGDALTKFLRPFMRSTIQRDGYHRPGLPGEVEWRERKFSPDAPLTPGDRQAYLYEVHRLYKAAAKTAAAK